MIVICQTLCQWICGPLPYLKLILNHSNQKPLHRCKKITCICNMYEETMYKQDKLIIVSSYSFEHIEQRVTPHTKLVSDAINI